MKKQWMLWLMLLALMGGWALADPPPPPNPTSGNPVTAVDTLFNILFPENLRDTVVSWASSISSLLTVPISNLALALFMLALIYRIYLLWLSEASSSSLIYSVIRYAFIGAFLMSANFYLKQGEVGEPLKLNSQKCSSPVLVLSHIGYCAWENGLEGGRGPLNSYMPKVDKAVADFIAAFASSVMAVNFFKVVKESAAITSAIKAAMKGGGPVKNAAGAADNAASQIEKRNYVAEGQSWVQKALVITGLLPFAVYFLLAIPSVIYSFLIIISGLTVIFSIILLPIAIALIAWGYIAPTLSLAYNILAQAITVFLLPTIFMLGFVFVLERPAAVLNGMAQQVDTAVTTSVQKISQGWDSLEGVVSGEATKQSDAGMLEPLVSGLRDIGAGLLGIGIAILMAVLIMFISGIFFIVVMAVSYAAGISLIGAVPNIILSLLGANNMQSPSLRSPALGPVAGRLLGR